MKEIPIKTTIQVQTSTTEKLRKIKLVKKESYEEVILRLIEHITKFNNDNKEKIK